MRAARYTRLLPVLREVPVRPSTVSVLDEPLIGWGPSIHFTATWS